MKKKKKNIFRKFFQKHTLIILNEEEQEEQFSFRLNKMNVLVVIALMTFFTILCTTLTLLYTPLKDYILPPTQQINIEDRNEILALSDKLDSITAKQSANDLYIRNIRTILSGKVAIPEIDTTKSPITSIDLTKVDLSPTKDDLELRKEVEQAELYSIQGNQDTQESGSLLFTPLKGIITSKYEPKENHLAIDIAAQKGEAIKSVALGTVIFTDWTPDTGYVVVVQHNNGMISVYKHALTVYKKIGEIVKKGEVIAAVGNTGELTTGPHLHFELWIDGNAVDPQEYIVF
jgi:murein DD-endopeptidase MepM/ murein hydrolase activator NlpD